MFCFFIKTHQWLEEIFRPPTEVMGWTASAVEVLCGKPVSKKWTENVAQIWMAQWVSELHNLNSPRSQENQLTLVKNIYFSLPIIIFSCRLDNISEDPGPLWVPICCRDLLQVVTPAFSNPSLHSSPSGLLCFCWMAIHITFQMDVWNHCFPHHIYHSRQGVCIQIVIQLYYSTAPYTKDLIPRIRASRIHRGLS